MSNYTLETYTNLNVIKINQDALGAAGERIVGTDLSTCVGSTSSCTNVWSKPLDPQLVNPDSQPGAAMVFLNVGGSAADVRCDAACWAKAGFAGEELGTTMLGCVLLLLFGTFNQLVFAVTTHV